MDKCIGFDIDHKHTPACVVQAGQLGRYRNLRAEVAQLREWLKMQRGEKTGSEKVSPISRRPVKGRTIPLTKSFS